MAGYVSIVAVQGVLVLQDWENLTDVSIQFRCNDYTCIANFEVLRDVVDVPW